MKAFFWAAGVVAAVCAVYFAVLSSPWPSVLSARQVLDELMEDKLLQIRNHAVRGVMEFTKEHYDEIDPDAYLDVFYASGAEKQSLATIVWVHGGGWISGSKDDVAEYLKILASKGFTAVGVDFSLAPGSTYPTPVRQVNAALAYLKTNAPRLHVDPSKFFLAGDASGAQIAAQLANVISSPSYAREMGIVPSIERQQLRGVILHCGLYDPENLSLEGSFHGFSEIMFWSYFGTKDYINDPRLAQFSVIRHMTAEFPPLFVSVGNGDPLAPHSHKLAEVAMTLGVPVMGLTESDPFFPEGYGRKVPHEYQFQLDTYEGILALDRSVEFATIYSH